MFRVALTNLDFDEAVRKVAGTPYAHVLGAGQMAEQAWGGQWQMIAAKPVAVFSFRKGVARWCGELVTTDHGGPFDALADYLKRREPQSSTSDKTSQLPPFISGALGHVSYEMAQFNEPGLRLPGAETANMDFGFYDAVGAWPIAGGEGEVFGCSLQAVEALRDALLEDAKPQNFFAKEKLAVSALSSDKSEYAYHDDVNTCRKDILEGEYFQANLSRQLTAILEGAVLERGDAAYLYEYMCAANPAAFSCLMQYEQEAYLSNSPERFFNIITSGGTRRVVAEPIKGTRQRSHDPEEDLQLIRGLARSEKDRAENIMITDLVRNDLSRICEDGTILEEKICDVQTYAHVHHLVSRVSGVLRPGQTAADILKASFPCGSITGAPKVRAMQAIADIEGRPRGIYCGSIGYVDDRGGADFSVAIRTATASKKDGALQLSYGSGGGVTVLSDPEEEWRETEAKAIIFQKLVDGLNVPGPSVP